MSNNIETIEVDLDEEEIRNAVISYIATNLSEASVQQFEALLTDGKTIEEATYGAILNEQIILAIQEAVRASELNTDDTHKENEAV